MLRYQLKTHVQLAHLEEDQALLHLLGSRLVLKAKGLGKILPWALAFLQSPRSETEFVAAWNQAFINVEYFMTPQELLLTLAEHSLVWTAGPTTHQEADTAFQPPLSGKALQAFHFVQALSGKLLDPAQFQKTCQKFQLQWIDLAANTLPARDFFQDIGVSLTSHRPQDPTEAVQTLKSLLQKESRNSPEKESVFVVSGSWAQGEFLRTINSEFLRAKQKYLLVLQDKFGASLGPWLGLKDGPCYECYYRRRLGTLNASKEQNLIETYLQSQGGGSHIPTLPMYEQILQSYVSSEIFAEIFRLRVSPLRGALVEFDFMNYRSRSHQISALPFCTSCSDILTTPLRLENDRPSL